MSHNAAALNRLAATQGMQWTDDGIAWREGPGRVAYHEGWNPSECLDDALRLLEHACEGEHWHMLQKSDGYRVYLAQGIEGVHKLLPVAITVCALRASGVSEQAIQQAMEETK